jgi:nucleoside-diphosphate-sugar epimerase
VAGAKDERTVLVTGASGALGPSVVNLLGERGYRARGLGLAPTEGQTYSVPVDWFTGDICDRRLLQAAMSGASYVVHMAALLHINNPPPSLAAEFERVNVHGTEAVVDTAMQCGVERLVFLSTIAVYGYGRGEMLSEAADPRPDTLYARTKLAAERIVLGARRDDGTQAGAVLRLAAVYGTRVKGNYGRLVTSLARGRFMPIGPGTNRRTLVHEKDVAAAIALALTADAAAGRVHNVTDGAVHTLREIIPAICAALGRPPPALTLPVRPVRAAARAGDGIARMIGRPLPVSSAMLEKYLEDVAVDGRRFTQDTGFRPVYGLQEGWQEAVAGMRAAGALDGHG